MFGFLQNNAFTKPGGFSKNVNMPLLLAGMGMMSNSQNPMAGGLQGLLGGIQYKQQQAQQAQRLKQQQQQQALQQKRFNMQQQQFNQQQAQQQKWNKYINSSQFTPQQQAQLQAVPMAQGVSMIQGWQKPQTPQTAKGADGYLYYTSGPNAGTRVLPNVQKAPAPAFAGNGMTAQAMNNVLNYNKKIQSGQQPTQQETQAYQLSLSHLNRSTTLNTPQGTYVQPGYNTTGFVQPGGQATPVQAPAGTQVAGGAMVGTQPAAGQTAQSVPSGFIPKEKTVPAHMSKAAGYAKRMDAAEQTLGKIRGQGYDPTSVYENARGVTNITATEEHQQYEQAKRDWARAKLRDESGAVISEEEIDNEIKTYFPVLGDSEKVVEQKKQARQRATQGMKEAAGSAFKADMVDQSGVQSAVTTEAVTADQIKTLSDEELNKMTPEQLQDVLKRLEGMEGAK